MRTIAIAFISLLAGSEVFASDCPNYSMSGAEGTFSGRELYEPKTFAVTAGGGKLPLSYCSIPFKSDRGEGYVTERPDFTIGVHSLKGYSLEFRVESDCDAILVINTGGENWYYDDDDNGNLDPKISLTRPSEGVYDVWVGTADRETCDAELTMETF
ncbi:hypothetical protein [Paracoccus sulfuroxidans]|uniref:hypothetical protein n=1 Tax=Paracoccus sulfuroxidans TaxID=384678 RepID=UPI001F55686D|nr:hypothetical protein [Paracoccus sulfuroxidans]